MGSNIWGAGYHEGLDKGLSLGLGKGRIQGAVGSLAAGAVLAGGVWCVDQYKKRQADNRLERRVRAQLAKAGKTMPNDDDANDDGQGGNPDKV